MALGRYDVKYDGFYKDRINELTGLRERFDTKNLDWANKIIVFIKGKLKHYEFL